ncbi:hypothetical protein [Panacagrimonas sp.]|uniref:hypothetical protein n=1 Tax=Panacagrimonas sp. TaxID=2480088 RepID=UPI003B5240D5
MKIDEAKETIAFSQWKEKTWPNAGAMQGTMLHSAWLASRQQPVRVKLFELFSAMDSSQTVKELASALAKLGIEVTDA